MHSQTNPERLTEILRQLQSEAAESAWAEFVGTYSPVMLQVVHLFTTDPDDSADCFLHIIQQLCANKFKRLRQFQVEGRASFPTWLRAVTRRLCIDWHRHKFGRKQMFSSIARLGSLEQQVFRRIYQNQSPLDQAFAELKAMWPALSWGEFSKCVDSVQAALTRRQLRLLGTHRPGLESLQSAVDSEGDSLSDRIADSAPDPESAAANEQEHESVRRALAKLEPEDRLILRLRFEETLTLTQIATVIGLPDAQSVDRRIRKMLAALKTQLGKPRTASV